MTITAFFLFVLPITNYGVSNEATYVTTLNVGMGKAHTVVWRRGNGT